MQNVDVTDTLKGTGERCGNSAMTNGKCHFHGGKTPTGDSGKTRLAQNPNA